MCFNDGMIVDHDIHVHTKLSACCSDPLATPANAIARAADAGLKTIGFANHLWDRAVPGAGKWYDWYAPQDLDHVLGTRKEIPADTRGVRVLVGCETEYCGDGKVGISPDAARQLDYVLIPFSHTHMNGFVVPDGTTAGDLPALLTRRFREVVALGLATGIAHPFYPLGFGEHIDEIMAAVSDADLEDCFGRAAEARVSIEIHAGMFPGRKSGDSPHFQKTENGDSPRFSGSPRSPGPRSAGLHDETFLRVLGIAKRMGCLFHFGSDAHDLSGVGGVRRLEPYARQLGITRQDILPLLR
jgi:histidinol phosphatase-like PHP family hydrolase